MPWRSSMERFQSTHPARGATGPVDGQRVLLLISIHAPREGCDHDFPLQGWLPGHFNPRTPRGVRLKSSAGVSSCSVFQSTHPARGATSRRHPQSGAIPISIHAPREGCDSPRFRFSSSNRSFQSTHPARGATANFTKEQRVCLAQFAYLHKGKKAEHTKTNAPMLHEAFLYAFWVRTGRRRRVLLDFARYKIKGSSGR